jgi:predicted permease
VLADGLTAAADRLRGAPGVEAVAVASARPMAGWAVESFNLPGRDSLPPLGKEVGPSMVAVSPDYFRATGVALLAGRDFDAADTRDAAGVLIVSRAMARLYWPGESAIGKCVKLGKRDAPCSTVIGVVADVHRMQLIEDPTLQYYRPWRQVSEFHAPTSMVVRTTEKNAGAVARLAAQELRRTLPGMATPVVRTVAQGLEPQLRPWRMGAQLFAALGLLALCVAAIGVYSVIAYSTSQRMHEMGVRVALGADARRIVSLVLAEGSRMVVVGVGLGIAASLVAGRLVSSLLFGIDAHNPAVLAATAIVLMSVGVVASLIPGIRAARVDPVTTLRAD